MTNIGKILVVLVTVCAVLFMGFAVTVFATRTNWRDKFLALKKDRDDVDAKKKTFESQVKAMSDELLAEVGRHKSEREANANAVKDQKANYQRLSDDHEQAKKDLATATAQLRLAVAEASARREEATRIRDLWKKTQDEKEDAMRKQFETEQRYIQLKGEHETLEARAKDLEQRTAELASILTSRGIPLESPDKEKVAIDNPPPVEGVILEVDKEGKFVKLSIGSDDGLRKLHKLDVYRVSPRGKYVGRVEIIGIDPDRSVARILPQFKQGNIQVGDNVATRFTASR